MNIPPIKTRHYKKNKGLTSQIRQDLSESAMEKKALSVMFLSDMFRDKPKQPRLVNTVHGKIEKLLLAIPEAVVNAEDDTVWCIYQEIFLKLPDYTRFEVLTHKSILEILRSWFIKNGLHERITFHTLPEYITFTAWTQDPFVTVTDAETGKTYLIEPHSFTRWEDGYIAEALSKATDFINLPSPLYFEGGNILIGDDFFLLGADYPIKSLTIINQVISDGKNSKSKPDIIRDLYCEYFDTSRKLIFTGSTIPVPHQQNNAFKMNGEEWEESFYLKNEKGTVQPVFHLDMFISLAGRAKNGKYRLLVGDPRYAARIINEPVSGYAMPEIFDNIAEKLSVLGFEVIRNPLPLTYIDNPEDRLRRWYFATGNNGLTEIIDDGNKHYWMPTYGYGDWSHLRAIDEENRRIWEQLGFKVTMLTDYHPLAENTGATHCIIKYLKRGETYIGTGAVKTAELRIG